MIIYMELLVSFANVRGICWGSLRRVKKQRSAIANITLWSHFGTVVGELFRF